MAVTKTLYRKANAKTSRAAVYDLLKYILDPSKTENNTLTTGYGLATDETIATDQILNNQAIYNNQDPRYNPNTSRRVLYHVIQSFENERNITKEKALEVANELAKRWTGGEHSYIVAVHTDKEHIHAHIVFDAVNITADRKFKDVKNSAYYLQKMSDDLCKEYNLSIIRTEEVQQKIAEKTRNNAKEATREQNLPSKQQLQKSIDRILAKKDIYSLDELITALRKQGYKITERGSNYSVLREGWNKNVRLFSNRAEDRQKYSRQAIIEQIAENKRAFYDKNINPVKISSVPKKVIDIQTNQKMQDNYYLRRWARLYNIQQQAITYNELQNMGYDELSSTIQTLKAEKLTAQNSRASNKAEIQKLDLILNGIKEQQKHLSHFSKYKPIFEAYKQSGYNKQFLEQNQKAIEQYRAARTYFNSVVGEWPKFQELVNEYKEVQSQKTTLYQNNKELYQNISKLNAEIKELEIIKHNADRLLSKNEAENNRHREAQERERGDG